MNIRVLLLCLARRIQLRGLSRGKSYSVVLKLPPSCHIVDLESDGDEEDGLGEQQDRGLEGLDSWKEILQSAQLEVSLIPNSSTSTSEEKGTGAK